MGPEMGLSRPGLRVLELGSGLGWLGMTLARNLQSADMVVLTEQEEGGGLDWLRHNLRLNSHLPGMAVVRAEPCDWRGYVDAPQHNAGQQQEEEQQWREQQWQQPSGHQGTGQPSPGLNRQLPEPTPGSSVKAEPGPDQRSGLSLDGHPPAKGEDAAAAGDQVAIKLGSGGHCSASGVGGAAEAPQCSPETSTDGNSPGGVACNSSRGGAGGCRGDAECGGGVGCGGAGGAGAGNVGGGAGDWLSQQQWNFIIGSDLVYNEVGAECLPRVMRALAGPDTRILYCHTKHRFDTHDMRFFEELAACGLVCTEVHEPSVPSPPPSPPPLTELFPEMRIAVYDIRLPGSSRGSAVMPAGLM